MASMDRGSELSESGTTSADHSATDAHAERISVRTDASRWDSLDPAAIDSADRYAHQGSAEPWSSAELQQMTDSASLKANEAVDTTDMAELGDTSTGQQDRVRSGDEPARLIFGEPSETDLTAAADGASEPSDGLAAPTESTANADERGRGELRLEESQLEHEEIEDAEDRTTTAIVVFDGETPEAPSFDPMYDVAPEGTASDHEDTTETAQFSPTDLESSHAVHYPLDETSVTLDDSTTLTYRTDGEHRLERPESNDEPELPTEGDEKSRISRAIDVLKDRNTIDNLSELGQRVKDSAGAVLPPSRPTGTLEVQPGTQVAYETPRDGHLDGSALFVAPVVLAVLGYHGARKLRDAVQSRMSREENGNDADK